MDRLQRAKMVRLKSRHDKFLVADEDEKHVSQDRNGSSPNARWLVELVPSAPQYVRLKSRYGRYLCASGEAFLLGVTGWKVLQSPTADAYADWAPEPDGFQVRLKTRRGNYLRANGGLPPWRDSVTHEPGQHASSPDWLWDLEVVEVVAAERVAPPARMESAPAARGGSQSGSGSARYRPTASVGAASFAAPGRDPSFHFQEPERSTESPPPPKVQGRMIHYCLAGDDGEEDEEEEPFVFNGSSLEQLTGKLKEVTGLGNIILCSRNPISGKLYPLHLHLPPNTAALHIVVVDESSPVAKNFLRPNAT